LGNVRPRSGRAILIAEAVLDRRAFGAESVGERNSPSLRFCGVTEETITQTARRFHPPHHRPAWMGRTFMSPVSPEIRRALPLVAVVAVASCAFLVAAVWSLATGPPKGSTALGAFALLGSAVIAEAFPVPIEGVSAGRTSLATVFIVAAAVIYDWPIAVVVAFLTMATV
jgi:hypothetical protein